MVQMRELLTRLCSADLEFAIVGGVAARLHGSTYPTEDLDICCPMSEANMARLVAAIGDLHPVFRGDPRQIPMPTDPRELSNFRVMILKTDLGDFDVLKEM